MADIELLEIQSGYNVSRINHNFDVLQEAINDVLLHRDGHNNVMSQGIDMDGNQIFNTPDPYGASEVVNKGYLDQVLVEGVLPIPAPYAPPAVLDMSDGLTYVMTDLEASAVFKILMYPTEGQELVYPASADSIIPQKQTLAIFGSLASILISCESGGLTLNSHYSPDLVDIGVAPGLGVFQVNSGMQLTHLVGDDFYTPTESVSGALVEFTHTSIINVTLPEVRPLGFNFETLLNSTGLLEFNAAPGFVVHNSKGHSKVIGAGSRAKLHYLGGDWLLTSEDTIGEAPSVSNVTGELDRDTDGHYQLQLDSDVTLVMPDELGLVVASTMEVVVKITQTAAFVVTWPASFKWAGGTPGVVSVGAGKVDILRAVTFDSGNSWYATLYQDFY